MEQQDRYLDTSDWDKTISPITLRIKKGAWEIFKNIIPRSINLKDAVPQLIYDRISKEIEEASDEEIKKWMRDQEYWKKGKSNSKDEKRGKK